MPAFKRLLFFITLIALIFSSSILVAEIKFDFGLNLFNHDEIRFDQSGTPIINLHLLQRYISEHDHSFICQLHAISRWFTLTRLSDEQKKEELLKASREYFAITDREAASPDELLRELFFEGLLLIADKEPDPENSKDIAFEDILLECEELLKENYNYSFTKGLLFYYLRNRPNNYFKPMKPEEDFKTALSLIPRTSHYYYILGQAFRMLGSDDTFLFLAIASYERSASFSPTNRKLQTTILGIYMALHEEYKARNIPRPFWLDEAVYRKILFLSPDNPYALNNLGYLYAEYGVNKELAQELCQRAVSIMPENANFHDSLGWAAFRNSNYSLAKHELTIALELEPDVYETLYHIATLHYSLKNYEEAEQKYREALKINPNASACLNNLAYLFAELNIKLDEAIEMAKRAIELEPNSPSYLDTLGWIYYRQGEHDKALEYLLKADNLAPGQGEIKLHIGRVYLEQLNFANALICVKEAFKADPDLEDAEHTLYLTLRLRGYYESVADYHRALGERVDKEKLTNILMAIARLYQDELLYEQSIAITRLCSDIKKGSHSLSEPLFNTYSLEEDVIEQATDKQTENEPLLILSPPEETEETSSFIYEEETTDPLPPLDSPSFSISLQPDFFKYFASYFPALDELSEISLTLFIYDLFNPFATSLIRIDSLHQHSQITQRLLLNYFSLLGARILDNDSSLPAEFKLCKHTYKMYQQENALYISSTLFDSDSIALLKDISSIFIDSFAAVSINWNSISNRLPPLLPALLKNPIEPFLLAHTRYSLTKGLLIEQSVISTGKEEDSTFMKQLALKLFAFKQKCNKAGLETIIKIRAEDKLIHIVTAYNNIEEFLIKKYSYWFKLFKLFYRKEISQAICFISRALSNYAANCPDGGTISLEPSHFASQNEIGTFTCSKHSDLPSAYLFFSADKACQFNRNMLQDMLKKDPKYDTMTQKEKDNLLNELLKGYNVLACPCMGDYSIEDDGLITCTEH